MPYKRKDSAYWWISYRCPETGKRIRLSSGTTVKKTAKALEHKKRFEAHQAENFGVEPTRTFDELFLEYLKEHDLGKVDYAAKTLFKYFTGYSLNTLTRSDITDYIRIRRTQGTRNDENGVVKDSTIRRELEIFRAAINWARRDLGWQIENPVYLPAKPEGRLRWLAKKEYTLLLESCPPHLQRVVVFAVNTGLRIGELLSLQWSSIHNDTIVFSPDQVKSKRNQSVPLNKTALSVLEQLKGQHPTHVFTYKGRPIKSIRRAFNTACKKAGIEGVTPHTLRHTAISWAVQKGISLAAVMKFARHSSIDMTMKYAHLTADDARAVATALEDI